jgi:hypothetical protein
MCVAVCFGQLKHDANWVFGDRCGVDFRDANNPVSFYSITKNDEPNASISDSEGILQLYVAHQGHFVSRASILGADNLTISNGDDILLDYNAANGAVFVPVPDRPDSIYLFHIGVGSSQCDNDICYSLYFTLIILNPNGNWEVLQKNQQLFTQTVEESIALVRKGNGRDWWMLVQKQKSNTTNGGLLYIFNVGKSISFSDSISVNDHIDRTSYAGELVFNQKGNLLLDVVTIDNRVFLNRFDRCSGHVYPIDTIIFSLNNEIVFSGVIDEPYIYLSSQDNLVGANGGGIYQCRIYGDSVSPPILFHMENISDFQMGQLERGPDGNIWVSYRYEGADSLLKQKFQKHMSVIENPSTDTARFVPNYLFMGDSASVYWGLPNFPNYNLGPEGVFLANAGKDTVLCSNTSTTGVTIGAPPVANVTYLWQPANGLSATNTAQPTANPAQSTWYYLTATDTTATSCAVNTDSVYVEVRTCTGITETPTLQAKLYPNPTNGLLTVEVPQGAGGYMFRLFNLLGQQVLEYPLEHDKTTFPLDFAKGIYIYQITAYNGQVQNGKLVVGE